MYDKMLKHVLANMQNTLPNKPVKIGDHFIVDTFKVAFCTYYLLYTDLYEGEVILFINNRFYSYKGKYTKLQYFKSAYDNMLSKPTEERVDVTLVRLQLALNWLISKDPVYADMDFKNFFNLLDAEIEEIGFYFKVNNFYFQIFYDEVEDISLDRYYLTTITDTYCNYLYTKTRGKKCHFAVYTDDRLFADKLSVYQSNILEDLDNKLEKLYLDFYQPVNSYTFLHEIATAINYEAFIRNYTFYRKPYCTDYSKTILNIHKQIQALLCILRVTDYKDVKFNLQGKAALECEGNSYNFIKQDGGVLVTENDLFSFLLPKELFG